MITSCRIRGFKCFSDLVIDRMNRIVVVGGRNNVGKTALLEALWTTVDRLNPAFVVNQYFRRGMLSMPADLKGLVAPMFRDHDFNRPIEVETRRDGGAPESFRMTLDTTFQPPAPILTENGAPTSIATGRAPAGPGALRIDVVGPSVPDQRAWMYLADGLKLHIETFTAPQVGAAFIQAASGMDKREEAQRFSQLDVTGRLEAIVDVLRRVEPQLRGLSLAQVGDLPVIHADLGKGRKLPIPFLGSGFGRLLSITLACSSVPGGVVFIDEIETGLHYAVHEEVWKGLSGLASAFDCQIIATTHSAEFLMAGRSAWETDEKLLTYVRLERTSSDVKAHLFDAEDLDTAFDLDLEIR